jgi:hypothetical protein
MKFKMKFTIFVIPKEDEVEIGHERKRTGEAIFCKAGKNR